MKRFLFLLLAVASTAGASRRLLLADSGTRELKLVDLKIETVQWKSGGIYCYDTHRLPSGNILYCDEQNKKSGKSHVRETTPDGKVVKKFTQKKEDMPEGMVNRFYSGFTLLKNGDVITGHWAGHGPGGSKKAYQLIQFNKEGKIVWFWHDPKRAGSALQAIIMD